TMADLNIPADIAPAEQALAVAPPTRTDDQIIPSSKWVPISKRLNRLKLDEQVVQIYTKIFLKDHSITPPANDNNPFEAPPSSDTIIEYVNTLGYPITLRNVSAMSVNALYQPWRAILSMINMCLTGKTVGFDRPRHPVLQILWGITHHSNIDYAERIWEEFDGREVFGIPIPDALLTDEITSAPYYSRYLEHVAEYQHCLDEEHISRGRKVLPNLLNCQATKSKIAKQTKPSAPKASKVTTPPKPTPITTEPSKKDQSKKRKLVKETSDAPSPAKRSKACKVTKQRKPKSRLQLVDEFVDEGVPEQEPVYGDEEADIQRAVELSIKEQAKRTQGPARPVVIREPDSGRIQPLPDVLGKGKEKASDEQRHIPTTTEPSGHAESPSLYAKLGLTDSETESDEEVSPEINDGTQNEGQAGPNPGDQDEG
ncbi:retrovirus-related pol polyprotein from transposon TNT 1-94, partial [Tanacetum coccineum]